MSAHPLWRVSTCGSSRGAERRELCFSSLVKTTDRPSSDDITYDIMTSHICFYDESGRTYDHQRQMKRFNHAGVQALLRVCKYNFPAQPGKVIVNRVDTPSWCSGAEP